jgi:hypothetical protein
MDEAKFETYLRERYGKEIEWYDTCSARNKRLYVLFQWSVIILSALIPVLTVALDQKKMYITAGLGVLLAIGTAGLKTFKFQENWINYRTIAEALKKERYYYDAGLSGYRQADDPQALFVERVEALISQENSLWVTVQRRPESESDKGK